MARAEQTWREIQSPHFRVLTNGSEKDGRNVAFEFEQMRHVFASFLKDDAIESGAPLTIVAARDGDTLRELEPGLWKARGNNVAGEFHHGWEKQFALTRLDTWNDQNQVVIYHEYTHSILHANTHWLPVWLDEGLAEFYAYTRFEHNRVLVGAPSARTRALQGRNLFPLTTMFNVNSRSPYYKDEDKVQEFYGESWAMVHFMMFGPNMDSGKKLNAFIRKLQDQEPQEKAFTEVFGDPKAFENQLSSYVGHFAFTVGVLPADERLDPKTFSVHQLTPAETDYELGCFHIGAHDRANGRALIEKAVALDPKLAGAHEELGYLNFEEGKDDVAEAEWKQAVSLNPALPRSLFALAMTGKPLGKQSPDELRATQTSLQHITTVAPRFAPPYVELALTEWRLGSMQQAFRDARKAETLEPWRAGYRTLTGRILLSGSQPALAATYSRYVAAHWFGPDHDEAVDLWNAVPSDSRGEGPALAMDMPAGVETARGTLTEVSCATGPGGKLTVTLQPDDPAAKPMTFTSDGRMMVGFSDTLWWGSDHFNLCHHVAGHPALLAYKPAGKGTGDLVDIEIRDDLPARKQSSPAAAQTQASDATAASGAKP